jgi:hypothetical protein
VPLSIKAILYGLWYDERMRRAAIYARVSTVDGRQDPETQLRQPREYAQRLPRLLALGRRPSITTWSTSRRSRFGPQPQTSTSIRSRCTSAPAVSATTPAGAVPMR